MDRPVQSRSNNEAQNSVLPLSRNALGVIRSVFYTLVVESKRGATLEDLQSMLMYMTRRLDGRIQEEAFSSFVRVCRF